MSSTTISYLGPLHEMTQTTASVLWNDSATLEELEYSIRHGAVGATCNPVIVLDALKREMNLGRGRVESLIREMPAATEGQIAWALVECVKAHIKRSRLAWIAWG